MGISFARSAFHSDHVGPEQYKSLLSEAYGIIDGADFDDIRGNDIDQWKEMMDVCGAVRVMRNAPTEHRTDNFDEHADRAAQVLISAVDYADEKFLDERSVSTLALDMVDMNDKTLQSIRARMEGRINAITEDPMSTYKIKAFGDYAKLYEDQTNAMDMVRYRQAQGCGLSDMDKKYIDYTVLGMIENDDDSAEVVCEDVYEASMLNGDLVVNMNTLKDILPEWTAYTEQRAVSVVHDADHGDVARDEVCERRTGRESEETARWWQTKEARDRRMAEAMSTIDPVEDENEGVSL